MNIMTADCGFDPHAMDKFQEVSVVELTQEGGFDLSGKTNMIVNLSAEDADGKLVVVEPEQHVKPGSEVK